MWISVFWLIWLPGFTRSMIHIISFTLILTWWCSAPARHGSEKIEILNDIWVRRVEQNSFLSTILLCLNCRSVQGISDSNVFSRFLFAHLAKYFGWVNPKISDYIIKYFARPVSPNFSLIDNNCNWPQQDEVLRTERIFISLADCDRRIVKS